MSFLNWLVSAIAESVVLDPLREIFYSQIATQVRFCQERIMRKSD
jgi:hypothetical protein